MSEIGKLLSEAFEAQSRTDTMLRTADGQEIRAHFVVMALACPKFCECLNEIEASVFQVDENMHFVEALLNYIYKKEVPSVDLPFEKMLSILEKAVKYDIADLANAIADRIIVNIDNFLDVKKTADELQNDTLKSKAEDFLRSCVSEVVEHNLQNITLENIKDILSDGTLNIKEADLLKLFLRWANQHGSSKGRKTGENKINLKKAHASLLKLIRFPTMTPEEFANEVVPTGIFTETQAAKILLYISSAPENRKHMQMLYPTEPRKPIHAELKEVNDDNQRNAKTELKKDDKNKIMKKLETENLSVILWCKEYCSWIREARGKFWEFFSR